MDDCVFCKIVKGDIPAYKIYEDEKYLAFLDLSQFSKGHTLVIPKEHKRFIWDIEDLEYFKVITKIANHYKSLGYEFVDSASFGRMVPHAHFHLIPHNGEMGDWRNALNKIGELQTDKSRWPSREEGLKIVEKFKL